MHRGSDLLQTRQIPCIPCLEIELDLRAITFVTKHELRLVYKGREIEKRYVPDLFVANSFVVELKAVKELIPDHEAQLFNYMRIARQAVGYLLNFGAKGQLEWKRFVLTDIRDSESPAPVNDSKRRILEH